MAAGREKGMRCSKTQLRRVERDKRSGRHSNDGCIVKSNAGGEGQAGVDGPTASNGCSGNKDSVHAGDMNVQTLPENWFPEFSHQQWI